MEPAQKTISETPEKVLNEVFSSMKAAAKSRKTRPLEFRMAQLRSLDACLDKYEAEIFQAKKTDLGMCSFDSFLTASLNIKTGKDLCVISLKTIHFILSFYLIFIK